MSRQSNSSKQSSISKDAPRSHPAEQFTDHRVFLLRSLERNDVDLAALCDLNRSLHAVKQAIVRQCGESLLLDLGEGKLRLATGSDALEGENMPEEGQDMCVDFLLRMKLRRKLLNRLSRRLMRVAVAMDGKDVAPPGPPKYGDLRLHIDEAAVKDFEELRQRREEAWRLIEAMKEANGAKRVEVTTKEEEEPQETTAEAPVSDPTANEPTAAVPPLKSSEATLAGMGTTVTTTKEEPRTLPDTAVKSEEPVVSAAAVQETSMPPTTGESTQVAVPAVSAPQPVSTVVQETTSVPPTTVESAPQTVPATATQPVSAPVQETSTPPATVEGAPQAVPAASATQPVSAAVQETAPAPPATVEGAPQAVSAVSATPPVSVALATAEKDKIPDAPAVVEKQEGPPLPSVAEKQEEPNATAAPPKEEEPAVNEEANATQGEGPTVNDKEETPVVTSTVAPADVEPSAVASNDADDDVLTTAYDILRDYKTAYERVVDPTTGKVKFTILDQEREEDHTAFKNASGIGAVHRSMNAKEKEAEFKRWQASLLSRIPEQPTFEQLGIKNRVFKLEERRKRVLEDDVASTPKKTKMDSPSKSSAAKTEGGNDSDDDAMDVDEDDEEGVVKAGGDEKADENKSGTPSKQEAEKEEAAKEESKRMKPISLSAIPSFYDQDLKRIKMVHQELMATSIQNHARRRLEEVTRDYNSAFRKSNELFERRQRLQARLIQVSQEQHGAMGKATSDYGVQFSVAKNRWAKSKTLFEQERLNKVLPSRFGRPPVGTPFTKQYMSHHDAVFQQVGSCVADIVDVVEGISSGQIRVGGKFTEQFVPPPTPSVFPDQAVLQQQEAAVRKELNNLQNSLRQSEEERNRTWKKMLKTKSEFDIPHHSGMRRMDNYSNVQPPPLRSSTTQSIPHEMVAAPNLMASYTPTSRTHHPGPDFSGSTSKYSAARVRERISADGTVAPVSEPKKTKEGLYQRPAGRTRKGMEWDAVRGIWVPSLR